MYSTRLIFVHFWLATIGIVLYVTSMWVAGIMEGLLWRETTADGSLTYTFIEILGKKYIFYFVRFLGGCFFLSGMCLMAYNCWRTVASGKQPAAQLQAQPA